MNDYTEHLAMMESHAAITGLRRTESEETVVVEEENLGKAAQ
jgi:hypothetical protein